MSFQESFLEKVGELMDIGGAFTNGGGYDWDYNNYLTMIDNIMSSGLGSQQEIEEACAYIYDDFNGKGALELLRLNYVLVD
jgi:hypothetical protein